MTTHPKGKERNLLSGQARAGARPDYSLLAGEDFNFTGISGSRDGDLNNLIHRITRRNCDAVLQIATPHTSDLRTEVANIIGKIAADLEARMSKAARDNMRNKIPRGKDHTNYLLNVLAADVLEWAGPQSSLLSASSRYDNDLDATRLEADYVAPLFEAFLLFVAHHINKHFTKHNAARLVRSENCRLILPIANGDVRAGPNDSLSTSYVDPMDFSNVECGMFPIGSTVEMQAASAPHLVVADAEMVRDPIDYSEAELRLARKTKALFFNQHNRRFAWGLTVTSRTIRAYVFGPDNIWASTEMDIFSTTGRLAFVSLLVDWSLCSIDRLGFDPTIRYEIDQASSDPYLEIDVHNIDASTGIIGSRTYYSQQCVGAADCLTGLHARYFTASASLETLDTPTFLIKDVWASLDSNSASDKRESSILDVLHAEFDKSSEFSGRFSQLVSTEPVHTSHGDTFVADSTAAAFAGLPNVRQVRQHRRTVVQWAGKMISAANNPSQVIVAVADAMAALNAAYDKCKILHGHISHRAILIQEMVGRAKGVLAEFNYAYFAGDSAVEMPELMLFQSICSLENPAAIRMPLDGWESLLYLVCWLGTFGINRAERMAYVTRYRKGGIDQPPILEWAQDNVAVCARRKRNHLSTLDSFDAKILSHMRDINGPLCHLAEDIYRVLFLHSSCSGTRPTSNRQLRHPGAPVVAPEPGVICDPLILRINHMGVILQNLLDVIARHRDAACAVPNAGGTDDGFESATPPRLSMSTKKHYMGEAAVAGPSKRLRH